MAITIAPSSFWTAIINWIYWYNERRLHGEIGDIPPAEYEQFWYTYNQPAPAGN